MPKWDASKRRLTYRFKSAVQVVGLDDLRSACASGFKRWQDVSVFTFGEAPEGSAGAEIEIGFYSGDHGDGFNFDGKCRILAHAFPPENGHFHYDADERSWAPFLDLDIEKLRLPSIMWNNVPPPMLGSSVHASWECRPPLYFNLRLTKSKILGVGHQTIPIELSSEDDREFGLRHHQKESLPRCGVADIVNAGASSVPTDRKLKHDHGLHTVSHYSFFSGRPKWSPMKANLTYRFSSSVQVVGLEDLRSACSSAFKRWQDVSHFTFQEASEGAAADIVIGFHRGNHGDGVQNAFDGPTLAHAFAPKDGQFHYDADEKWSLNPSRDQVDLESVAVHEIGHLLGLNHTLDIPGAIMYPEFSYGIIKRNLYSDDIEGIRVLYS
ncbi:hypothetical protein RJ639_010777 [Escallonia herrerae]|uniref:Peptidase metallopeptidase domain-containing protein n=1 Tax=Escallonia herrerae TaxID=1293975 RepID=A0AA88VKD7_9ASTE|nr:hypothetical protein RJ639_010777 [Escallonia herrerae]